jgi:tetratricopeptide (TPR) repeat protein
LASHRSKRKKVRSLKPEPEIPVISKKIAPATPMAGKARLWMFRVIAVVFMPLLFLCILEAGLRLAGYGYPTGFYLGPDSNGSFVANEKFGYRFFPEDLARKTYPGFIAQKSTGTIRIFILGGSAALGDRLTEFNFGRIIEAMLQDRYPNEKFEVVNAAVTAINSHVVREIAKECAEHQPDLYVVYMGNNEVVGPFGPGTVFNRWTPSLQLIRANIWVKSIRTGQLLGNVINSLYSSEGNSEEWQGMAMFVDNLVAADDPRLETVYERFQENLIDICDAGRRAGAAVVLSTVVVNLKDCPPFSSRHRDDISNEDLQEWESSFRAGISMEGEKKWSEALEQYELAARIDDRYAELHFRMGRCLTALNRPKEAHGYFSNARDLDNLRFRADTKINPIIRKVAEERKADGIFSVNAERMLGSGDSVAGEILGEELFYDHVHFTFDGNYALARAVLDQVEAALPQLAGFRRRESVLTIEECADVLALTPWDESTHMGQHAFYNSRPPFSEQLDHADRLAALQARADSLRKLSITPEGLKTTHDMYQKALKRNPEDWMIHHRFGNFLSDIGEMKLALDHLYRAQSLYPWWVNLYTDLGDVELKNGNDDKAMAHYRKALEIEPDNVHSLFTLGAVLSRQGRIDEAIDFYEKTLKINPDHVMARVSLGKRLTEQGKIEEAMDHFHHALEVNPEHVLGNHSLGYALSLLGRTDEAIAYYQKTLEIDPEYEPSLTNLGIELSGQGRIEEAIAKFKKAVELNPKNAVACLNLGRALIDRGKKREAVGYFLKTLEVEPRNEEAYFYLGITLADQGRFDEAVQSLKRALSINPGFTAARQALTSLLAGG